VRSENARACVFTRRRRRRRRRRRARAKMSSHSLSNLARTSSLSGYVGRAVAPPARAASSSSRRRPVFWLCAWTACDLQFNWRLCFKGTLLLPHALNECVIPPLFNPIHRLAGLLSRAWGAPLRCSRKGCAARMVATRRRSRRCAMCMMLEIEVVSLVSNVLRIGGRSM
jgi:hypothetical protein